MPRPVRLVVAAVLALAAPVALAPSSWAAKAPAASVTLTAPASGTSTLVGGVTMTGKAAVPTGASLVLTVDGAVSGSAVAVARNGTWSRYLYVGRVGVHRLCADVRTSAGAVLASSCVTWEMRPDPDQFSLSAPYDGQETFDVVNAGGLCQPGASVLVTVDGADPQTLACDPDGYGWSTVLTGVVPGEHTLTASLLANDGATVVASRSVTWTARPRPLPDIEVTSPTDGGDVLGRQVVFTGTLTNVSQYIEVTLDGYDYTSVYVGNVGSSPQPFEETIGLPYGSHEVCLSVDYYDGATDSECLDLTVLVEPERFRIDYPYDGSVVSGPTVTLTGSCVEGSTVEAVLDSGATGTGTCDQWSSWYVQVPDVTDGPHTATVTNRFEDRVVTTGSLSFVVDGTGPAAPVVTTPAPGSTITTSQVEVYGTGDPGGTVTISWPGNPDQAYISSNVNEDGTWSLTLYRNWFEQAGVLTGRRATVTATVTQVDRFDRPSPATTVTWQTRVR